MFSNMASARHLEFKNRFILSLRVTIWFSVFSCYVIAGLELSGGWGLNPPSSCLQMLMFEWESALNFNPWAKFQTFRQLTPPPPSSLGQFQHCVIVSEMTYTMLSGTLNLTQPRTWISVPNFITINRFSLRYANITIFIFHHLGFVMKS